MLGLIGGAALQRRRVRLVDPRQVVRVDKTRQTLQFPVELCRDQAEDLTGRWREGEHLLSRRVVGPPAQAKDLLSPLQEGVLL